MSDTAPAPDPFQIWRDWVSQSERQWNDFFNEMMATEQFGESMGQMTQTYLTMQRNMSEAFGRYFVSLNLPTRTDVLTLGNRLVEIEDRLSKIEAQLEKMAATEGQEEDGPSPRKKPARTRKPPKE